MEKSGIELNANTLFWKRKVRVALRIEPYGFKKSNETDESARSSCGRHKESRTNGGEGGSDTVQGVERVVGVTDDSPGT